MSVGIIVAPMMLLPAFFRHVGSPINAWFGTFAGRTHAFIFTTISATRRLQSEAGLAGNSERPDSIEIGFYSQDSPSKDIAIASIARDWGCFRSSELECTMEEISRLPRDDAHRMSISSNAETATSILAGEPEAIQLSENRLAYRDRIFYRQGEWL